MLQSFFVLVAVTAFGFAFAVGQWLFSMLLYRMHEVPAFQHPSVWGA